MFESVESMTFDGVNLVDVFNNGIDSYFIINDVRGRGDYYSDVSLVHVPGMDGAYVGNQQAREGFLEVEITMKGATFEQLNDRIEKLRGILLTNEEAPITFADEPGRTYFGRVTNIDRTIEQSRIYKAIIYILRADPFRYGDEETVDFEGLDSVIVENKGTEPAKPIFELTAKKKSTFAMIANGDEQYNLIGQPADDDVQIVDTRTSILYENGSTINDWQTATTAMIDESRMPKIAGEMTTDSAGIRADGYGTGDKLHGPAVFKEIDPIQDFEIETTFDIISRREIESWRMGINFLDENMQMLGHIGIKDNHRNYKRRVPLARYGPYRGSGAGSGNLIGDNQKNDNARETTLFYLRAKRIGNTFDFYIGEWQSQKHIRHWHEVYRDVNNEYGGKLKYITLYVASFSDRVTPSRLRINSVEVFELSQATVDETPYIIYPDDVVTFDHDVGDVLLNGELSKDTFFGDFFELPKGFNTITVSPSDTFDAKIRFRERWR